MLNVSDSETWNECQFVDPADDCTFYFLYYYDGLNNLTVWVKEEKDCPAPLPVLVIVLIVIAGIVLLGLLLLLLWKILTMVYDRREYARFEKDRMNARWDTVCVWILTDRSNEGNVLNQIERKNFWKAELF